jgi:hypothetical protein
MSEQKVYIDGNVVQVSEGTAQVVVRYTGAPSTTGLGIRVHFDSSLLTVTDVSGVLTGSIFANSSPTADTDNYDGDASTDVFVDAAWASLFGGWPGSSDVELMTITFAADADFVAANINFSASSSAEGFEFVPVSATVQAPAPAIEVDNTSATVDENAPVGTEVATVSSGLPDATFSIAGGDASGSDPVIPDLAAATQHVYVSSSTRSEDGTQETLQITYNADAGNTGLGLRIHFDSTKVSVASLEDVLPGSIFANSTASADTDNFDNDASTDSYIDIAWASLFGGWPGATPASLATLTFDIADGATGSTAVNFSASSNASGFEFAPQNHALTLSAEAGPVTVDAETGVITTNQVFDYETDAPIEFTVVATGSDGATAEETVQLTINNMDEVAPTITSSDSVDAIDENDGEGQVIYTASADDSLDISSGITFSLSDDSDDALSIDSVSGAVTLASDANYESQSVYSFTVVASDGVNAVAEKSLSLDVNDLDETAPQFDSAAPAEYVWDSNSASQVIYTAEATDYDDNGNENPTVEFSLENASADLAIDQYTGDVTVEVGVDSVQSSYDFDVVASDGVNQSSQPVSINIITDITAPSISSPSTVDSIDENSGSGQVIYTAQASDENSFTWDLSNDSDAALSIDSSTGEVTLSDDPNYEAQSEYNFTVVAIDSFDNSSSLSLSLEVNNLDEVAPTINSGDTGVAVDENSGAGQLVYAASADDSLDTSAGVTFSLADDSLGFSIDAVTGDVTTNADFAADFESAESQSFVVVASDGVNADVEQQVTIAINNLDEVAPSINSGDTGASVDENSGAGQVVYTATATDDADTGDGFSFSLADDTLGFSIDADTGVVTTNDDFAASYEDAQSQSFTVVATDLADYASEQVVTVAINNLDEVAPIIDSGDTGASVNENSGAGQVVYTAAATDTDANIEGITFNLADDTLGFSIDAESGVVTTNEDFAADYEGAQSQSFIVVATDVAGNASEQEVTVAVNNLDEVAPTITSGDSAGSIDENSGAGSVIYTATADDSLDTSAGVTFSLSNDSDAALSIDAATGAVTLASDADYEAQSSYSFTVVASDGVNADVEQSVTLDVDNLDEVAPVVTDLGDRNVVNFKHDITSVIYTAVATDLGDVSELPIAFSFAKGSDPALSIDSVTGEVTLDETPNYAVQDQYQVSIIATDAAGNTSAPELLTVNVTDDDPNAPLFGLPTERDGAEAYTIVSSQDEINGTTITAVVGSVDENIGAGQVVYAVNTVDASNVTYSLSDDANGAFTIDELTGEVTLVSDPDFESGVTSFSFTVLANDQFDNSSEQLVTLSINNLDDTAPVITSSNAASVEENSGADQIVYIAASSSDPFDTGEHVVSEPTTYSLAEGHDPVLAINATSGEVSLMTNPDQEAKAQYVYTVIATDAAGNSSEQQVTLTVGDVDDTAPTFTSGTSAQVNEKNSSGTVVYTAEADDSLDVSVGAVTFSLTSDSDVLSIDSITGDVSLDESADHEVKDSYQFIVAAEDAAGNSSQQNVTLSVTDLDEIAPEITSAEAVSVDENHLTNQVIYTASSNDSVNQVKEGPVSQEFVTNNDGTVTVRFFVDSSFKQYYESGAENISFELDYSSTDIDAISYASHSVAAETLFEQVSEGNDGILNVTLFFRSQEVAKFQGKEESIYDVDSDVPFIELTFNINNESAVNTFAVNNVTINEDEPPFGSVYEYSYGNSSNLTFGIKDADDGLIIDEFSGDVSLSSQLTYLGDDSEYSFTVVATDEAGNFSEQMVTVAVNNLDEVAPTIDSGDTGTAVDENSGAGQVVYTASATDTDANVEGVTLSLADDSLGFSIDENGVVTTNADFAANHEDAQSQSFTVVATDVAGNASEQVVTVAVNNLDEVAPTINSGDTGTAVDENSGAGQVVYTASATDTDANVEGVTLSLADDSLGFSIDENGVVTSNADFAANYEDAQSQSFTVVATDEAGNTSEQVVTVAVNNLDEVAPTITSSVQSDVNGNKFVEIDENSGVAQVVYTANATDSDFNSPSIDYRLTEGSDVALSVTSNGEVILARNPDYEAQAEYHFGLIATDAAGNNSEVEEVTIKIKNLVTQTVTHASSGLVIDLDSNDLGSPSKELSDSDAKAVSITDALAALKLSIGLTLDSYNGDKEMQENAAKVVSERETIDPKDPDNVIKIGVTTADVLALVKYAFGEATFKPEWVFENSSSDDDFVSYEAYLKGDVNGSWVSSESAPVVNVSESAEIDDVVYRYDPTQFIATSISEGLGVKMGTGEVYVKDNIEYSETSEYLLNLESKLSDGSPRQVTIKVINDTDSQAPVFKTDNVGDGLFVDSDSGSGQIVYVAAADDSADYSEGVVYSLGDGSDPAITVNANGDVVLNVNPDYEAQSTYSFTVNASDGVNPPVSEEFVLSVREIPDVTAPTINSGDTGSAVDENSSAGQIVYTASASDDESESVTLSLADDSLGFSLDPATGVVTTNDDFTANYEDAQSQSFTVVATDVAGNTSEQVVTVAVNNLDEVAPTIDSGDTGTAVNENSGADQVVYTAAATDTDANVEGVTLSLADNSLGFSLDSATGVVTTNDDFAANYEDAQSQSFTVVATDVAGNTSEQVVTVAVNNLDEVAPTITSGDSAGSIDENSGGGTVIYTATADDTLDASGGVTFSLSDVSDAALSIDASTGAVTLASNADYETNQSISFTVVASDAVNPPIEQSVTLTVNNLDEVAPSIDSGDTGTSVDENSGADQVVYTASATDTDANVEGITFSLVDDTLGFSIDAESGVVTTNADFAANYEDAQSQSFTVVASDEAGNASEQEVTVAVNNLDEVAPTITSDASDAVAVNENSGADQVVYTANATDTDANVEGITFSLADESLGFSIDADTGVVTTNADFAANYEDAQSQSFTVVASDVAGNASEQLVTVAVNNVDEVAPTITSSVSATIDENSDDNSVIYTASAIDTDSNLEGVTFSLSENSDAALIINPSSGAVRLLAVPDYEVQSSYSFTVVATDEAGNVSEQNIILAVNNIDEVKPSITSDASDAVAVNENSGADQVVYTASATDADYNVEGVTFSLADESLGFSIDADTGVVTTDADFAANYEDAQSQSFTVVATDVAGNTSEQVVTVAVNNLDEVAPTIDSGDTGTAVDENSGADQVVYTASATDTDANVEGVTLSLADNSLGFSLDPATGVVTTNDDFTANYEDAQSQSFTVVATDVAGNTSEQVVTVAVNNLDEVAPTIDSGDTGTAVNENSGADQVVYTAAATDTDANVEGVTLSLADNSLGFSLDSATGVVTTNDDFAANYEDAQSQSFTVVATDVAGNTSEQVVTVAVNNLDEVAPTITSGDSAGSIDENSGADQVVYTASATDTDANVEGVTLSLADNSLGFSLDPATGVVTTNADFSADFESAESQSFTVVATDVAGNTSEQVVTVAVNNLDEVAPSIDSGDSAGSIDENSGAGSVIYRVMADDSSDINGVITYGLSEFSEDYESLSINSSGDVSLLYDTDYEVQEKYSFIVTATDAAGNVSNELVSLKINNLDEIAPMITSGDSAGSIDENSGAGSVIYTATADDSQDISAGVIFSLAAGHDAALSIDDSTGEVTLASNADYETNQSISFTVVASDGVNEAVEQSVTLDVNNLDEVAPTITSVVSDASSVDENSGADQVVYTAVATDTDANIEGISFSLADDSLGFSIDADTGAVSTNADFAADYEAENGVSQSFTVVATDVAGNASEQVVTIAVNNLDEVAPSIDSGDTGAAVNENSGTGQVVYTATASDDADTSDGFSFSLADNNLGFSIDAVSGEVTTNADFSANFESAESQSFTVVATDVAGNASQQTVSVAVNNLDEAAPTVTSTDAVIVVEGTGAGQVVYNASADDSGDTSDGVSYSLVDNTNYGVGSVLPSNTQMVSVSDATLVGDQLTVAVEYDADDADLTGLGLRIHFDNSELSFTQISDVLDQDIVFTDDDVQLDTEDLDNNASTNSFVHVAWASVDGNWTGDVPTQLLTMEFDISSSVTGNSVIDFSASDNAMGYDFVGQGSVVSYSSGDASLGDLAINSDTGAVTLLVDPDSASQAAYDFTVVATDDAGLFGAQEVTLSVAEVVSGESASVELEGAIEQKFIHNADGSITLQLFISDAVAANYVNGIENMDMVLGYNADEVGVIVSGQISAPSNPMFALANDSVVGEVSIGQIFFPTAYSASAVTPLIEVNFDMLDDVSSATFDVSGVILGMDDVSGSSYDVSVTTYSGTDGSDVFALVGGMSDVNSGAGSDIFVLAEGSDANILVDFESGVDVLELGSLLDSAGYTGLSESSDASDSIAHQVSGDTLNIADLISDADESLDNAFGGYLNDETNVLTVFADTNSSAYGIVELTTLEITLDDSSTMEDDDLVATLSAFIA